MLYFVSTNSAIPYVTLSLTATCGV